MTVQELASKMNELMREGFKEYDIRITVDGRIFFPLTKINFVGSQTDIVRYIKLSTDYAEELIPITKSDLERAERACYEPADSD